MPHYNKKEGETMTSADLTVLEPYCKDDMRLLKKLSKSIFLRLNEPLTEADYDDFYSIANMTLWQCYNSYSTDKGASFNTFLCDCLKKRFKTEIRDRHREKRVINQFTTSLDATNDSEEECSLLDFIASDFDTFEEVTKNNNEQFQDKVQQYISKLSNQQVNILNLLIDGYTPKDIRQILEISSTEYAVKDWGCLDESDKQVNNEALKHSDNLYLLGAYQTSKGKIYIITNNISQIPGDTATTICFSDER